MQSDWRQSIFWEDTEFYSELNKSSKIVRDFWLCHFKGSLTMNFTFMTCLYCDLQEQIYSSSWFEWTNSFWHCILGEINWLVSMNFDFWLHWTDFSTFIWTSNLISFIHVWTFFEHAEESVTWMDPQQLFHRLKVWQKWRHCELNSLVTISVKSPIFYEIKVV